MYCGQPYKKDDAHLKQNRKNIRTIISLKNKLVSYSFTTKIRMFGQKTFIYCLTTGTVHLFLFELSSDDYPVSNNIVPVPVLYKVYKTKY